MSVTDGIGQTTCSFEHYLVVVVFLLFVFVFHVFFIVCSEWWNK